MKKRKSKAAVKKATARASKKQNATQNKATCQCGRVETNEPLEFCETCPVCNEWMHTVSDKPEHEQRHAVSSDPPPVEKEEKEARKKTIRREDHNEIINRLQRAAETLSSNGNAPRWETFFMCQRYPVLRGQLLTAIMAGKVLEVERINKHMLLDVVLLATACREQCEAEIVDDYQRLLERTEEEWGKPDWTCKTFSSLHADWANNIINHGTHHFESYEAYYIPSLAQWLLEHDVPNYFSEELTEEDGARSKATLAPGALRARKLAKAVADDTARHVRKARVAETRKDERRRRSI